jgi:acetyl esterase/lipase
MPLDPYVAERVHLLHEMAERGFWSTDDGRQRWAEFFAPPVDYVVPEVVVEDRLIARPDAPDLRVLVYRSAPASSGPGLVWLHGGGFSGGSVEMFEGDGTARELAARTGGTVVSVDYRLADATTIFPAPFDDVRDAWEWTLAHAPELGITGTVALGGTSAGAALAAGTAVALRDARATLPGLLVLIYPTLHPVLPAFSHELAAKLADIPAVFDYGPDPNDPADSPMLRTLLGGPEWTVTSHAMAGLAHPHGLPRTLIVNAEYDQLRASGQAFAAALAEAGVDVEVRLARGVLHGHLNLPPVLPPVDDTLTLIAARLSAP